MNKREPRPRTPSQVEFAVVYEHHLADIVRYLRRRLGDQAAEDAAAEVFVRALRRADSVELCDGSPLPWLYGIAANVIAERRRAETRRLHALERLAGQPAAVAAGPGQDSGLDPELMRALRNLKQIDRETLLLIAWGELTYEQTARALNVPLGTIRSRVSRARAQLNPAVARPMPGSDTPLVRGQAHV